MEVGQRQPREECPAFLDFVRQHPCRCCGAPPPSQAAHLRMANEAHGKRYVGKGEKPSDRWATPLCSQCHLDGPYAQHRVGEERFWADLGLNPFTEATKLWLAFLAAGGVVPDPIRRPRKPKARRERAPRAPLRAKGPKRKWPSRPFPKRRKP